MKFLTLISNIIAIFLLNVFLVHSEKIAPENEIFAIQPKIGAIYNIYNSNFNTFLNSVDCGTFESGNGLRATGSINFEKYFKDKLAISLGIGFNDRSGKLTKPSKFPSRDLETNEKITVFTENILDVSVGTFSIAPAIKYDLASDLFGGPLRLVGGINLDFTMSPSFDQYESIVSPANATFTDANGLRTQKRDIASGEISTISSMLYGFHLGFENLLPVSSSSYFTQSLTFEYFLNNLTSDTDWKTFAVKFELGFRIGIKKPAIKPEIIPEPEPEPETEPEPIIVYDPEVNVQTSINDFVINTGNELLASSPIVNAVFFTQNSDDIPNTYITENDNLDYFKANALDAHNYLFPRITEIIRRNPEAKLILKGATSGSENENGGINLAKSRAENVKNTFIKLGINPDIISTESSIMPNKPTNQEFAQGILENQRVDIIVQNASLQEYVDFQEYAILNGDFKVDVDTVHTKNENIRVSSNISNDINNISDSTYLVKVVKRIDNFDKIDVNTQINVGNIVMNDFIELTPEKYPIIEEVLKLDRFAAILRFDYNSSVLSDDNKALLTQLSQKLPENSTIIILGSADALGTDIRNKELSEERAFNTEVFIKQVSGNKFNFETGTNNDKFSEDTPQGRFLNRSIKIIIKKN